MLQQFCLRLYINVYLIYFNHVCWHITLISLLFHIPYFLIIIMKTIIFFFGGGGGGEIFDSRIFLGGKILQISFWWLDLSWDFLGVFKAIWRFLVHCSSDVSWPRSSANKVRLSKGVNFWSKDFFGGGGGLLEALRILGGFDFCTHSIIPVTWNPERPYWALMWVLDVYETRFSF